MKVIIVLLLLKLKFLLQQAKITITVIIIVIIIIKLVVFVLGKIKWSTNTGIPFKEYRIDVTNLWKTPEKKK